MTVHSAHITTIYRQVFLKIFLVIPWRTYVLLTLQLCSTQFFENVLRDFEKTIHISPITTMERWVFLKMFLVILRSQYILLTLLLCTGNFFSLCPLLLQAEWTYSTNYYFVQLRCSENVLIYSEVSLYSAHNSTMYVWVFLKMFLVIPSWQNLLRTLLVCSAKLIWKCC